MAYLPYHEVSQSNTSVKLLLTTYLALAPYVWSTARTTYLAAGPWQVMKAADDQGWLKVPGNWTAEPQYKHHPALAIWATDGTGLAVDAIRMNKLDYPSLELRGCLVQAVSDPDYQDVTEPALIEVGGMPALQCVATATIDNTNLVFLITVVETPENFGRSPPWQNAAALNITGRYSSRLRSRYGRLTPALRDKLSRR